MVAQSQTPVDIANFALNALGAGRIISLSDESEKAIILNLLYNHVRQKCLTSFNWQFARKRVKIAALADKPAFEYAYQYELPIDFLRLVQANITYTPYNDSLIVNSDAKLYTIENNKILTNLEPPLSLMYTADIEDTTFFTPLFVNYFYLELALEACESLTQSNTKKAALFAEKEAVLKRAAMADKTQLPPQQLMTGSFLDSRVR